MNELIYKQQAIDAIYNTFSYAYCNNCENNGKDNDSCDECHRKYQNWSASKKVIENTLNCLPSTEQEIIRCKECKHYRSYAGIIDGYCDMAEWYGRFQNPNDFCSRAKRRIDE